MSQDVTSSHRKASSAHILTRNLFGTLTVSISRDLFSKALEIFREEVRAMPKVEGLVPNFIAYPLHSNAISKMTERGGNALGIQPREDSLLRESKPSTSPKSSGRQSISP